jgi:UPF0176 protein
MPVIVSAFYKFVQLPDAASLRGKLLAALAERGMRGTILLAAEGINGTVSGESSAMASFLGILRADARFADLVTKNATADVHPFKRLKVKLKREIITFGHAAADPTTLAGTYVAPGDWNALIADADVLVLDTRNAYEVAAGTFAGAVDPKTRSFGEFAGYVSENLDPSKHKRVAMFCTGGIRCEKASAYLKLRGFESVYHLQGGILNYLATVPRDVSLWRGDCFVFDEREGVDADTASVVGCANTSVPTKDTE